MSKLYCLFAGADYYPEGGAKDFRAFGTVDELRELYALNNHQWHDSGNSPWGHIAECETMRIVWEAEYSSRTKGFKWVAKS
jgi:hypothetical protein